MSKSNEELELENAFLKHEQEERKYMENKYAIKLVEKIVFGLVTLIMLSVMGAIISLVLNK